MNDIIRSSLFRQVIQGLQITYCKREHACLTSWMIDLWNYPEHRLHKEFVLHPFERYDRCSGESLTQARLLLRRDLERYLHHWTDDFDYRQDVGEAVALRLA